MFTVSSVMKSVGNLYRDGVHEAGYAEASVNSMLGKIDFNALAQALCHNARHAYMFTADSNLPGYFDYRGRDLFGQRAVPLYEDPDDSAPDTPDASRAYELWLLENGMIVVTSRVTMTLRCPAQCALRDKRRCPKNGQCVCVYRDIRRYPWQSEMRLDLESLTEELRKMCLPVYRNKIPVYEL